MKRSLLPGVLLLLVSTVGAAQPTAPLPLDPLTPEEVRVAERVVREDGRVRELAGPNGRLIYVQFISVKRGSPASPEANEPTGRSAEVVLHNDANGGGVRALIDLTAGRVVDAARMPEASVPISTSDVEMAVQLALADPSVRRLLGERAQTFHVLSGALTEESLSGNYIEGLHTVGVLSTDPCTRERCVILLFNSGDEELFNDQQITVDL
ncbi:MAG: hypothetical protein ABI837_20845, partial [Acidobacteriota bacterium]